MSTGGPGKGRREPEARLGTEKWAFLLRFTSFCPVPSRAGLFLLPTQSNQRIQTPAENCLTWISTEAQGSLPIPSPSQAARSM